MESRSDEPSVSLTRVAAVTSTVLLVWAGLSLLAQVVDVLFVAFLAAVFASLFALPVSLLARVMPRGLAAILVMGSFGAALVLGTELLLPRLALQMKHLIDQAPRALHSALSWWQHSGFPDELGGGVPVPDDVAELVGQRAWSIASRAVSVASTVLTVVSAVLVLLVMASFLAYDPRAYLAGIVKLVPTRHEKTVVSYLHRLGRATTGWAIGTAAAMAIVGTGTAIGLYLMGIDAWLALGLLALFGEFIPYAGPIVAAIPALAIALGESTQKALMVGVFYLAIQQVESNVLQPLLMRWAVRLQPALLLIFQLLLGVKYGFLGLFVATPLLACIQVTVDHFWIERTLGKRPPGSPSPSCGS